jgi:biopolymer transport protein TolQ
MTNSLLTVLIGQAAEAAKAAETSVFSLVLEAGPVVKFVMFVLLVFSVVSWAIIFLKAILIRKAQRESEVFLKLFWESRQLEEIYRNSKDLVNSPLVEVFAAGYVELQRFKKQGTGFSETDEDRPMPSAATARENIGRALKRAQETEVTKLEKAVPFLATCGNTSPFIGLFGTVWGIMNSFQGIRHGGGGTGLEYVAGGISEALVATAMGLFAAIPAVIAYNYFVNRIRVLENDINGFASEFMNILERHVLNQ